MRAGYNIEAPLDTEDSFLFTSPISDSPISWMPSQESRRAAAAIIAGRLDRADRDPAISRSGADRSAVRMLADGDGGVATLPPRGPCRAINCLC